MNQLVQYRHAVRRRDSLAAIVRALRVAGRPLKGAAVARRVGKPFTGGFRGKLSLLCGQAALVHTSAGYSIAERCHELFPDAAEAEPAGATAAADDGRPIPTGGFLDRSLGSDYTGEELEFLRAVDRYRWAHHRPFPTCREVLSILVSLGYRKPAGLALPHTFPAPSAIS